MYVKIGDFQFAESEASISHRETTILSPRGFPERKDIQFDIMGEVNDESISAITARLNAIKAAVQNFVNVGLYDTGDVATSHILLDNDTNSLTGNIVRSSYFPPTEGGEYANGRQFHFTIGAIHKLSGVSNVLYYEDNIRFQGNGGPVYRWNMNKRARYWGFYPELIAPASMQNVTHFGVKVTSNTWHLNPTPFYSPPFELNDQRVVEFVGPKTFKNGYTGFTTKWSYHYQLPGFDDTLRPSLGYS